MTKNYHAFSNAVGMKLDYDKCATAALRKGRPVKDSVAPVLYRNSKREIGTLTWEFRSCQAEGRGRIPDVCRNHFGVTPESSQQATSVQHSTSMRLEGGVPIRPWIVKYCKGDLHHTWQGVSLTASHYINPSTLTSWQKYCGLESFIG